MLKTPQTTFISSEGKLFTWWQNTVDGLPVETLPTQDKRLHYASVRPITSTTHHLRCPLTSGALWCGLHPVCGMSWDRMDPSNQL